jgi:hypothetical protein
MAQQLPMGGIGYRQRVAKVICSELIVADGKLRFRGKEMKLSSDMDHIGLHGLPALRSVAKLCTNITQSALDSHRAGQGSTGLSLGRLLLDGCDHTVCMVILKPDHSAQGIPSDTRQCTWLHDGSGLLILMDVGQEHRILPGDIRGCIGPGLVLRCGSLENKISALSLGIDVLAQCMKIELQRVEVISLAWILAESTTSECHYPLSAEECDKAGALWPTRMLATHCTMIKEADDTQTWAKADCFVSGMLLHRLSIIDGV